MFIIMFLLSLLVPPDYTAEFRARMAPTEQEQKLAAHIKRVYPKAPYAELLACRIMREAQDWGLDPALFAAIAWTESGYRMWVKGSSGEVGLWQILPGNWLSEPWEHVRKNSVGFPDKPWRKMSRRERRAVLSEVVTATYFAAWLVDYHLQRCGEHTPECYAAYNSGNWKRVRPFYVRRIRRRAKAIRARLNEKL